MEIEIGWDASTMRFCIEDRICSLDILASSTIGKVVGICLVNHDASGYPSYSIGSKFLFLQIHSNN
jgi:hypothetical protein